LPTLNIVIVNWNSGDQLRGCLQSIRDATCHNFTLQQVIVVDNASTDGSMDALDKSDLPLTTIRNPENVGFGAACNQGAGHSDADYVLFLNPDMRLFETSLDKPVGFMEQEDNGRVGICGIQLVDDDTRISKTCARFPTFSRLIL
jgi:GT2 family glycosyltransferase